MWHILSARSSDSEYEWLYLIGIVAFVLISTVAERLKKLMANDRDRPKVPPRPTRPPTPPMRRPRIPQLPESQEPTPRSLSKETSPRPPARPVTLSRPSVRPSTPSPRPVADRTVEERKAILRGQPMAPVEVPRQVAPPTCQRVVADAVSSTLFTAPQEARATSRVTTRLRSLKRVVTSRMSEKVAASSFRKLSAADLQRAMVLKEILEPPLSLRMREQ